MKESVRKELKELCYFIIENNNALARPEQLTRVQMLYERLLVLNYLEELEEEGKLPEDAPLKPAAVRPKVSAPVKEDPVPSKPEASQAPAATPVEKPKPKEEVPTPQEPAPPVEKPPVSSSNVAAEGAKDQPTSINDHLAKGAIQVGLNDRIAFVKHLFNDSQADFNRVLSQLNTLDTYLESMYFIENLVKPDYDWEDKKPYEDRLIELVKKRFGEDW